MISTFVKFEFLKLLRKRAAILNPIYISIFVFIVFLFSMGDEKLSSEIAVAILLSGVIFASIMVIEPSLAPDIDSGFLLQLSSSGVSLTTYLLSKLFVMSVFLLGVSLVNCALSITLMHIPSEVLKSTFLILPLLCISCCAVLIILSLLATATRNPLNIFILAIPFMAPLLILSSFYMLGYANTVMILFGITCLYTSIYCALAPKILSRLLR